ncbi:MAG TPA: electron transfer flavoprotein subunit beta/FixA family protein [Phycisphaerae bacterium]|nr:electron transfer flavoprotein subunit beta/FixA family protein [Phycisphaerae bacterium]HUT58016.1 electron transfer flavoprotein subunit beta/FixA family protein [Phycisphaerae bacterium]
MGYNCVVCVKQVPDTKRITGEAMTEAGTVNRGALPAIFNPEDLNALELALSIRDEHGGSVTVVTMGPPAAAEILREALYRGADRVVLITDRRAAASDTLATSYILACAVKKLGGTGFQPVEQQAQAAQPGKAVPPDLVLCGRQAIDGDTAQVGPQLAEKLGFNLVTYVEEFMGLSDGRLRAKRNVGAGWEVVSCELPALLTVMETANTPRPPSMRCVMKYKKARCPAELGKEAPVQPLEDKGLLIEQWSLDDFGADLSWCGLSGSPTKVHRIQSVVLTGSGYHEYEPTDDGAAQLISALIEDHTIG